jgi:hypothetical protein
MHTADRLSCCGVLLWLHCVCLQRPRLDVISMPGDNKGVVG